jgi:hypothetical protein
MNLSTFFVCCRQLAVGFMVSRRGKNRVEVLV